MKIVVDILQSKAFTLVSTIAVTAFVVYLLRRIFRKVKAHRNSVYIGFLESLLEAIVVALGVASLARLSSTADTFINTMVMSSSVIVVVLGFIFQEGTKNIIHGFFISVYRPFEVGDRIRVNADGKTIDGYVEELTLRHTVVRDCVTNVRDIIPNQVMDTLTVENYSRLGSAQNDSNAGAAPDGTLPNLDKLVVEITYESDLDRAKEIMQKVVCEHPDFVDYRTDRSKPVPVRMEALADSGIDLSVLVSASTRSKLYCAVTDDRERIYREFCRAGIEVAYPHMQLLGGLTVEQREREIRENTP